MAEIEDTPSTGKGPELEDIEESGLRECANVSDSTVAPDSHGDAPGPPGRAWGEDLENPAEPPHPPVKLLTERTDRRTPTITSQRDMRASSKKSTTSTCSVGRLQSKARADIVRKASKPEFHRQISEDSEDGFSFLKRFNAFMRHQMAVLQKYSMPLIMGVLLALVWSNASPDSYHDFIETPIFDGAAFEGHDLHLHFLVNDIFMCFFFGLAIKEVTEALLPGGSLNPLSRAVNPLMATLGGVVGPVGCYALVIVILWNMGSFEGQQCLEVTAGGRRLGGGGGEAVGGTMVPCTLGHLLKGWGVPTATDISLAWMFALLIFGPGHIAINFLLLLAIVDDALGMIIIAVFYPDPANPVKPLWLLLVCGGSVLAFILRKLNLRSWMSYVILCGPLTWYGLIKSHVHPALALVFVVPLMPATHAVHADDEFGANLGACDLGPARPRSREKDRVIDISVGEVPQNDGVAEGQAPTPNSRRSSQLSQSLQKAMTGMVSLLSSSEEEAPLHVFEEQLKLPVDLGMFFFGLANAGVKLGSVGGMTAAVFISLLVGKTVGIVFFSKLAEWMGFGLPEGLYTADLVAMAAIAGVGLTVALFVANEAFVDPELRGQAKMGAVLSVACGGFGYLFRRLLRRRGDF